MPSPDSRPARSPAFQLTTIEERIAVVRVVGELDIGSADVLRATLDEAEAAGPEIIRLDASKVAFLDSTALGVILASAQRMTARGGHLELVCESPAMRRILDLTMISRTVHLLP
jgi:anti-sigma B factor antagonist